MNKTEPDKLLYFSNVPWKWIAQRPHYIAIELARYFPVDYIYKKIYHVSSLCNRANLIPKEHEPFKIKKIFKLPFERHLFSRLLNNVYIKLVLAGEIDNYEILWFAEPSFFMPLCSKITKHQLVIYDCMDDLLEFPHMKNNPRYQRAIYDGERALTQRADVIFVSSQYLMNKLLSRYDKIAQKIYLLPNALSNQFANHRMKLCTDDEKTKNIEKKYVNITYVGTISEWFDFDLVLKHIDVDKNVRYTLYGPIHVELPKHERLNYAGVLNHDEIADVMSSADVLVMPFKLTELILSVDPVKAYEYIASGSSVVLPRYGETEKFKEYVDLYKSPEDYVMIMKRLAAGEGGKQCSNPDEFIRQNCWKSRIDKAMQVLRPYLDISI